MTTVLVGARGWLGSRLALGLPGVAGVRASEVLDAGPGGPAALARLGPDDVVVNAAGARGGDADLMERLNALLPMLLAERAAAVGAHLVHLGSAAEYGLTQDGVCREDGEPNPGSPYGRTKLAGTLACLASGHATVLRLFNVADVPPQPGTPLADVAERLRVALASGTDVELLSPGTVRDWVTREFVVASVRRAAELAPAGVYNVCSGIGVGMGEAVEAALRQLGSRSRVVDLGVHPPSSVVGTPDRWRTVSGLRGDVTAERLGQVLSATVTGADDTDEGKRTRW